MPTRARDLPPALAGLVSVLLSACAPTMAARTYTPPGQVYATQVGYGPCVFADKKVSKDFGASVLGAIAATAISKGVNRLGAALKKAGEATTWDTVAWRNLEVSTSSFPDCVQIVRGRFSLTPLPPGSPGMFYDSTWTETRYQILSQNGLWLNGTPDFFFEGAFRASENRQALTIEPVMALLNRPIAQHHLRLDKERSVAVFVSLFGPSQEYDNKDNPSATILLGTLRPNRPLFFPTTKSWNVATVPFESTWFTLSRADAKAPLSVAALVTETQDESAFLSFIGDVLTDADTNNAIATAIKQEVIPADRDAAKVSAATIEVSQKNEADLKLGDALSKLRLCAESKDNFAATAAAARAAMREANLKASVAGTAQPFSSEEITTIAIDGTSETVKAACARALTS